jgi:hypothetical protein
VFVVVVVVCCCCLLLFVVVVAVVVVAVVVDCYCFLLNIIVEPLLPRPSHLASAKCMILSKPIVWPQPNDGPPG